MERLVGKYFPYGQERPSATTDGKEKFATYFRDSETGLDYAQNRYHQPGMGRFMTPDPYAASGGPSDPGSWNRYVYTRGDPVNRFDPAGTQDCNVENTTSCYCQVYPEDSLCNPYPCMGELCNITPPGQPCVLSEGNPERCVIGVVSQNPGQGGNSRGSDIRKENSYECDARVIDAMKRAWSKSSNGASGTEGGFALVRKLGGGFDVVDLQYTNQKGKIEFKLVAGTFAIFHTHPNTSLGTPSQTDIATANGNNLLMVVMSMQGLWEYDPTKKVPGPKGTTVGAPAEQLAGGLDWMKPCPTP